MKIILFGLGSIGLRHGRILKQMEKEDLYAFRSGKNRAGNPLDLPEISSWKDLDKLKPDVALITNPTFLHLETALPCAERGMALFIEKPIDSSTKDLEKILGLVARKKIASYVAYVLRFHPAVVALKEELRTHPPLHARFTCVSHLPDWREGRDHLTLYSASRELGGGVILDLSHEFDLAYHLFGPVEKMTGRFGRAGNVTVNAEDYADALLRCGTIDVNVHLNFLSRHKERTISCDTEDGYFEADLNAASLRFESNEGGWVKNFSFRVDDLYRAQFDYFFGNIANPVMMNNLAEAAGLFRQIISFREKEQ